MSHWLSYRALVVVLALSGCGSPASEDRSDEEPPRVTSSAQPPSSTPADPPSPMSTSSPASAVASSLELPAFTVSNGKVKGPARLSAKLGDDVAFTVTSDVADEVHVHTYDVTVDLEPGRLATVRVHVDIPGVHEVELEESHLRITQLRVSP